MTYSGAATVAWAKTQVGFHEGWNNYNPYSAWQYGGPNNPWCASFQCMAQYMGGYRFKGCTYGDKGEAYVPTEALRAQAQGTWRDKYWRAEPGDAVFHDWEGNGEFDHVSIVVYDDGKYLLTIGGNTSDAVAYRTYDRSSVVGFWALSQDPQAIPDVKQLTAAEWKAIKQLVAWKDRVCKTALRQGDTNSDTLILNNLLVKLGFMVVSNNTYWKATRSAVYNFKRVRGMSNTIGYTFGCEAATEILSPK